MGSSSKYSRTEDKRAKRSNPSKGKPKREVQVFSCPTGFPISSKPTSSKRTRDRIQVSESKPNRKTGGRKKVDGNLLDWHDTAKEIRAYGATAFEGKQKRDYEDEQYFKLTGRHKKKQKVPLPIVRGIKKAAAKRDARVREEAKQAGIILPKAKKEAKKYDSTYDNYGPAPSIGFMKNGVFRVQNNGKR